VILKNIEGNDLCSITALQMQRFMHPGFKPGRASFLKLSAGPDLQSGSLKLSVFNTYFKNVIDNE